MPRKNGGITGPRRGLLGVPLPRNGLEVIGEAELLALAKVARIDAVRDLTTRLSHTGTGLLQRHLRVSAHRERLRLASEAVVEAPPAPAVRLNDHVQTIAIEELVGLGTRRRGPSRPKAWLPQRQRVTPKRYPYLPSDCNGLRRTSLERKCPKLRGFRGDAGLTWTTSDRDVVGVAGFEPATPAM